MYILEIHKEEARWYSPGLVKSSNKDNQHIVEKNQNPFQKAGHKKNCLFAVTQLYRQQEGWSIRKIIFLTDCLICALL